MPGMTVLPDFGFSLRSVPVRPHPHVTTESIRQIGLVRDQLGQSTAGAPTCLLTGLP